MEEKIINGVLCHLKEDPMINCEKEWVPYTPEALTTAFRAMSAMYESADIELKRLKNILEKIGDNVKDYYGIQF